jgi:hypothetical protein
MAMHVGADQNPDLLLHGILSRVNGSLDAQMLLDSFKKQLDLPALAVKLRYQPLVRGKVFGQNLHSLAKCFLSTKRRKVTV